MTEANIRVREDLPGFQYRDYVIKTGLAGFFRNQKQRRQLSKMIQHDATEISRSLVAFSRYLDNRCRRERNNDQYFEALGQINGICLRLRAWWRCATTAPETMASW